MEIYLKRFDDKLIKVFDTESEKKKELIITTVKDYQKEAEIEFYVNNKKIGSLNFKDLPPLKAREINIPVRMEIINKNTLLVQYKMNNSKNQYFLLQLPKEKNKKPILSTESLKPLNKKILAHKFIFIFLITFFGIIITIAFFSFISTFTKERPSFSSERSIETIASSVQKTAEPIMKKFDKELLINYINQNTPIHFIADSTLLLPGEEEKIKKICDLLQNYIEIEIVISGHTEPIGKEQNEMNLSIERAKVIEKELKKRTEKYNLILKIETKGYGGMRPLLKDAPEELKFKNRRVEIEVIDAKGKE